MLKTIFKEIKPNKTSRRYLMLILVLSIVVISTVSVDKAYAAEVYPTITHQVDNTSNSKVNSFGTIISQFFSFVKDSVAQNNIKNKHIFNLAQDTNKLLNKQLESKDNFIDINDDPNKKYINFLANNHIISLHNKKFNPDNFVRLHECSKLLINSYRFKLGYDLTSNLGLSNNNYFDKTMPKYYNTAYEMGLLNGVSNNNDFERIILYDDLYTILKNFETQYPEMIDLEALDIDDFSTPSQNIKRSEIAKSVIKVMKLINNLDNNHNNISIINNNIDNDNNIFIDTHNHKYLEAIEKLASMEIIDTSSTSFYPNRNITRGDFITILVKGYLKVHDIDLNISNLDFNIKDLDYNSDYAPFVVYAKEKGMLDYLIETKRGETYIDIDREMSKHEVYHTISKTLGVEIDYNITQADINKITRAEVAQIMIDSCNFQGHYGQNNSQIEELFDKMEGLTEYKKLVTLLF